MMAAATKNSYNRAHDEVIMEALKESPDNRNEAFRIAERKLKEKFNMKVNANQISSRYYTYIKPNYLEKDEPTNHRVTSAGGSGVTSLQYDLVKELTLKLSPEELKRLFMEVFDHMSK